MSNNVIYFPGYILRGPIKLPVIHHHCKRFTSVEKFYESLSGRDRRRLEEWRSGRTAWATYTTEPKERDGSA
jgi:hypothetical protein